MNLYILMYSSICFVLFYICRIAIYSLCSCNLLIENSLFQYLMFNYLLVK